MYLEFYIFLALAIAALFFATKYSENSILYILVIVISLSGLLISFEEPPKIDTNKYKVDYQDSIIEVTEVKKDVEFLPLMFRLYFLSTFIFGVIQWASGLRDNE